MFGPLKKPFLRLPLVRPEAAAEAMEDMEFRNRRSFNIVPATPSFIYKPGRQIPVCMYVYYCVVE